MKNLYFSKSLKTLCFSVSILSSITLTAIAATKGEITSAMQSASVATPMKDFKITDPNLGHKFFTDALNNKNIERLVALYADDAVMIAPGNKKITGKRQIRQFFKEVVPIIEKISLDTVFRINYSNTVVFRSSYTVVYKNADGTTTTQSTSGIEVEQKQKDGSWLFIVDHHYGGADLKEYKALNQDAK